VLVLGGNWKLVGAVAYYAFDNAVLWAAFHAYGRTPALGVLVMGYLVGSLGAALPIPAGIGAVEGGLLGAPRSLGPAGGLGGRRRAPLSRGAPLDRSAAGRPRLGSPTARQAA